MNGNSNRTFLNKNDNRDNEEEEDFSLMKPSKKDKNKKIEKFEKFKPKNPVNNKKEPSLKGAENKVRSILSSFLLTMESEDDRNNKKIRFLRDKLSTKKIKVNNIKNIDNTKPSNFRNFKFNQRNSDSFLVSNEKRAYKDNFYLKKKISIHNGKLRLSNVKLNIKKYESHNKLNNLSNNFNNNNSDFRSKSNSFSSGNKNVHYLRTVNSYKHDTNYTKRNTANYTNKKKISVEYEKINNEERNSISKNNIKHCDSSNNKREESTNINFQTKKDKNINNNKNLKQKRSSAKDKVNTLKIISNDSNLSSNISSSQNKEKNDKKKFSFFKGKENQLQVLKDYQEQIRHSIILRPEDLQFDEITHRKKKSVVKAKAKIEGHSSKKTFYSYRGSRKSQNDLINKEKNKSDFSNTLITKGNIKILEEKKQTNKNDKLQLPKIDLFKSSNLSNTEIEALKSGYQEEASSNVLPISSSKKMIIAEKYRIITHKKLIYDSLDDEEIEEENDSFYLNPESYFVLIFDFILLIVSLYSFIAYPFYIAHTLTFCSEKFLSFDRIFNLFIELIYILDFIFSFFRAYYNFEEQLIKNYLSIINKYLYGWFIFDLMGAIPFYSIIKFYEKKCDDYSKAIHYNHILNNINYLYLCNRLFKVTKSISSNQAYNFISNIINDNKYYNQISLFLQICFIVCVLNFSSCLYIFIGRNSFPNWIMSTNLETKTFLDIYISSIYLLITALTTVGYGDITCYSFKERIFQLLLLIVGIVAYSWIISYISNYVKKINEKSLDFENRKLILDEIKLNNPSLSSNLYERVLRHLKYKKYYENKDKSIIFDCLPLTLKNNLIAEMYKPIIKNFIFFKSFQNTDFIVRVILSFRPILAMKNDMLVNEGDFVEEIIFVKKGVLTVELPLNIQNPEENINKYLNNPILQHNKNLENGSTSCLSRLSPNIEERNIKNMLSSKLSSTIHNTQPRESLKRAGTKKPVKRISYVKILNIRANEHFGDVLMFLEQRSPLCVRVRSKKAELFFLKKIDAISISSSYQSIWRRINKKSVFNFKQIIKSIIKIVELYCAYNKNKKEEKKFHRIKSVLKPRRKSMLLLNANSLQLEQDLLIKKYKTHQDLKVHNKYSQNFIDHSDSSDSEDLKIQSSKNFSNLSMVKNNNDSSYSLLNIFDIKNSERNNSLTKNNEQTKRKNKSLFKIVINNDDNKNDDDNNNKINKDDKANAHEEKDKDKDNTDNINDADNDKDKSYSKNDNNNSKKKDSVQENEILMDIYKRNFKFYKLTNLLNAKTIIKEEGNEESLLKRSTITRGINFLNNNTIIKSSIVDNNNNYIRENENEENDEENKENKEEEKAKEEINKYFNNNNNTKRSNNKELKSDNNKTESYNGTEEYKKMYVLNEENNKIVEKEKSILKMSSSSYRDDDENNSENLSNNLLDDSSNTNRHCIINDEIYPGEQLKIPKREDHPLNTMENINKSDIEEKISTTKDFFQENSKVKMILGANINVGTIFDNQRYKNIYNKKNTYTDIIKKDNYKSLLFKMNKNSTNKNLGLAIESNIRLRILSIYENLNSISKCKYHKNKSLQLKIKNIIEKEAHAQISSSHSSDSLDIKKISKCRNNTATEQIKTNKTFSAIKLNGKRKGFNSTYFHNHFVNKNNTIKSNLNRRFTNAYGMNKENKNSKNNGIGKNKTIIYSPDSLKKKRKNSLLSRINTNIEKTNQNLNNPDEFYSNYFQSLLGVEKINLGKNEKKRFSIFINHSHNSSIHNNTNNSFNKCISSPKMVRLKKEKIKVGKKNKSMIDI